MVMICSEMVLFVGKDAESGFFTPDTYTLYGYIEFRS